MLKIGQDVCVLSAFAFIMFIWEMFDQCMGREIQFLSGRRLDNLGDLAQMLFSCLNIVDRMVMKLDKVLCCIFLFSCFGLHDAQNTIVVFF